MGNQTQIDKVKGDVVVLATDAIPFPEMSSSVAAVSAIANALVPDAVPPPPKPGVRYPDRDLVLSPREQLWSDVADPGLYATGPTTKYQNQLKNKGVEPGMYYAGSNATIQWENIGGDWFDANGDLQGKVPFASTLVIDKGSGVEYPVDFDVRALVQAWVNGDFPNWGLRMQAFDTGAILWRSKFAPNNHPVLTVDGVDYQITSNVGLTLTSFMSQAGAPNFQTSYGNADNSAMLYFDLSAIVKGTVIGKANLRVWTYDQYGNSLVNIFRVSNPAYRNPLPAIEYGIAASYPLDVGIEADPKVAFVQKFDADYNKRWMYSTGTTPQTLITDQASLLVGKYNWLELRHIVGQVNTALEAHVSTWRGYGALTRPKVAQPPMKMHLRYYIRLGADWSPQPAGGKSPGFDMRFADMTGSYVSDKDPVIAMTLFGTGRGSSGSGSDGVTGPGSARGNYNRAPSAGVPLGATRGFGTGDCYNAMQMGPFGVDMAWSYLANLRLLEENCIELMVEMNTVTDPTQKPRMISSITNLGGALQGITVVWHGSNYTSAPTVTISDAHGSGAAATATVLNGAVTAITLISGGQGYVNPTVTLSGGGSNDAVAAAVIAVKTARVQLVNAETDPKFVAGARWTIAGVGTSTALPSSGVYNFNTVAPITPVDATHFDYPISAATIAPYAVPGYGQSKPVVMCCLPSEGNPDGKLGGWINGRCVFMKTDIIWRHSAWLPDGKTEAGVDAAWMCLMQGGGAPDASNSSLRMANIIVADEYIGPMVA